jgi:dolichol-phosphate mannosyltransferase
VPTFNEEENVGPLHEAVVRVLSPLAERYDRELLFVDDGSRDGTVERLREIARTDPGVRVIRFSRNFGHQAALTAGLEAARGDAIVTMDCDLQDPPELLLPMIRKWEEGSRIVYARRRSREDRPFKKWTAEVYYRLLARVSEVDIPRQVGDFRLIDRVVLANLIRLGEHARYLRGMVAWLGFRHDYVDFDRPERIHGKTHYPLRKMLGFAMDGLLSFSFSPLRVALWVGVVSISSSGAFLAYMLYDHLVRRVPYPLFKWLTVIVFGFVGAQFILLWILGEYVGRIYTEVRQRPLYVVDEEIGGASVASAARPSPP